MIREMTERTEQGLEILGKIRSQLKDLEVAPDWSALLAARAWLQMDDAIAMLENARAMLEHASRGCDQ